MTDYLSINRDSWNRRTPVHVKSEFYEQDSFLKGRNSLNSIELELLGDIRGKKVLHLQCHFGQDSISLARLGAEVTAVDFSDTAIEAGRKIAGELGTPVNFICTDIYSLPGHLSGKFDIIFTSYGTIGWLPDLGRWANLIDHYLDKGGRFVMAEFHPVLWMFDNDAEKVCYSYFNREPITELLEGTYADLNEAATFESVTWNHGLGEVFTSLLNSGLHPEVFKEFDYSPYSLGSHFIKTDEGKYMIKGKEEKLPLVYAMKWGK